MATSPDGYIIYADGVIVDTLDYGYTGYDAWNPAKIYGVVSYKSGYESDPCEIDLTPMTTSGVNVYGSTDPDTSHHSGYGFNATGYVVTYSLSNTSNWPLIDHWICSDFGFPMLFFSPDAKVPPLNSEANFTANSGTVSFDDFDIADPPGSWPPSYYNYIEIGVDTVYSLWIDPNANSWDNTVDHFAKIKVVSINGLNVELKITYQPIAGLRWLVTP